MTTREEVFYMENRERYIEVAKDIYAVITPATEMDITDAGMMDNFSNSAYINRGDGLVCDTFFDLPHAEELKAFCVDKSGHAPKIVVNTHGHWDHFWGNQVFDNATIIGHKDMLKDCTGDEKKVPVFKLLHNSKVLQNILNTVINGMFKKYLPKDKKAKVVVTVGEHDFDLTNVKPVQPNKLIEEEMVIDLDGLEVHLLPLGAIHSSSDTVVWIPSEKVLFAGDIFADCSMPTNIENAKEWIKVMDYILDDLDAQIIVPGHGEVYDRLRAENQREYFKELIRQFEEYYTSEIKLDDLISKMDVNKYIVHRPRISWIMAVNMMFCEKRKK